MLTFEQLTNLAKCSYQRAILRYSKEELETFNMFAKGFPSIKPRAILWNFEEPPAIGIKVTISRALYDAIHEPVNSLIPNPDYTHLCCLKYRLGRYHLPLIVFYIDFEQSANLYSDWQWLKSQGSVHILEHYGIPSNNWGCMFDWFERSQATTRELIRIYPKNTSESLMLQGVDRTTFNPLYYIQQPQRRFLMSSSLILQQFSKQLNEKKVLTHPEDFLGPNTEKLLEFWSKVEKMTKEQLRVVKERYDAFCEENYSEWCNAVDLAFEASEEIVEYYYAYYAGGVAEDLASEVAYWATREIIGGVENPVFVPMFDDL